MKPRINATILIAFLLALLLFPGNLKAEEESKNAARKSVIIIKADKGIPYGKVATVMGDAKAQNITDISITVK